MEWQQFVMEVYSSAGEQVEKIVEGLTPDELNKQPAPGANTVGWLIWHLTRSFDRNFSEIAGKEQLWIADGLYKKFGRAADPNETGYGHTPEEAASFKAPDSRTLLEYHKAIQERIKDYISTLTESELDRESTSPTHGNTMPVYQRLLGLVNDGWQHVGQAAYVRGLITKQGWYGR